MIAAQRLDPLAILQALLPPLRFLVSTMNILFCVMNMCLYSV